MQVVAAPLYRSSGDRVSANRNGSVDYLRLVAAAGIVVFHLGGEGARVGYAGLPVLAALMGVFAVGRLDSAEGRKGLARQTRHLMLIWLAWSGLYGMMKLADLLASGASFADEFALSMLLTGPAIHLWFLPFAAGTLTLMRLASGWLRPCTVAGFARCAAVAGCASLAGFHLAATTGLPTPLPQWAAILPSLSCGLLRGMALGDRTRLALWGAALVVVLVLGTLTGATSEVALLAAALAAVGAALALPLPQTSGSDLARRLSMSVYLLHPLVVAVLLRLGDWPRETLPMLMAVLAASAIGGLALLRSPFGRWSA